jgi:leader peptidase (prepilin peptidase)/N-methyltransferase
VGPTVYPALLVALAGFGLVFGSFANVIIWRLPRGESLSTPGSHCPRCGHPVRWFDNVPVVSWLALRGRCRDCGEPISPRYPLVEALSGTLWLASGLRFGISWETAACVFLFYMLLVLSFIDLDTYRLPNPLVGAVACVGAIGALVAQLSGTQLVPLVGGASTGFMSAPAMASVVGAVIGAGITAAIAGVYAAVRGRTGMGAGDVKLLGAIGLFTGPYVLMTLVLGSVVGSVVGVVAAVRSREPLGTQRIPFGPFLALGCVLTVLFGPALWSWYLGVLGVPVPL